MYSGEQDPNGGQIGYPVAHSGGLLRRWASSLQWVSLEPGSQENKPFGGLTAHRIDMHIFILETLSRQLGGAASILDRNGVCYNYGTHL